MKKARALALRQAVEERAVALSNKDRPGNVLKEDFTPSEPRVESETVACEYYLKSVSKKFCLVVFVWHVLFDRWIHFVVSDSDVLGLKNIDARLRQVEQVNFNRNFKEGAPLPPLDEPTIGDLLPPAPLLNTVTEET